MLLFRRLLRRYLKEGTLAVIDPGGHREQYGRGEPRVTIRIRDASWPHRVLWKPALAIGEGYMDGAYTIEEGGLQALLQLCLRNKRWGRGPWIYRLPAMVERFGKRFFELNSMTRARGNVAHHYELSADFFDTFLDGQRQYSCAYFATPEDDLETAQQQKLSHIAAKLCLKPGMTVLDVGCGWGGLGLYLARRCGARVTGVTLAQGQLEMARRAAAEAGLSGQVEFRLQDYRQIEEQYDRVVSVGMFEHVGSNHYRTFFRRVRACLKPRGIALVHAIGRADGPGVTNAWTRKYIFPGGYCPALSELIPRVEQEKLFMTDLEILRLHYAETTRLWLARFSARRDEIVRSMDERFYRMWEFYLASAEASFRWTGLMVFQLQLARDIEAVPLTRDYIATAERSLNAVASNRGVNSVRDFQQPR